MSRIAELLKLKGRRALVTGAAGSLGRVIAETLAELGADLILVDQEVSGHGFASALSKRWCINVECLVCDLEDQMQRFDLIEQIKGERDKGLNILINNAAFVGSAELQGWAVPFEDQTIETWRRALEVNLTAVFDLSQGLSSLLKVAEGGSIINISSIYGMYAPDWKLYAGTNMSNPAGYAVSKGGLLQLTRWLATTIAPNVRVNAISPGGIFRNQPESFIKSYESKTPLGRMATEDDFRGAIAYLASDLSKYVTGENLLVDGGWGIW
jgi:NAD(P)-dependent dehydrogenase (short-subunit alcohol dehydrogenase family)